MLFKTLSAIAAGGSKEQATIEVKDLFARAQNVTSATAGGFTVPTNVGPIIEALVPFSAVIQAGAQVVNLTTDRRLPQVTALVGAQWCAESQAVTSSELTLAALTAMPRRLSALVEVSKTLLTMAPELAEPMIDRNVRQAIGYALDVGCLVGTGGPEPVGILNDSNASAPVTFAGPAALLDVCTFEKEIGDNFAEQGQCTFIGSVSTREKWRQTQKFSGSSTALWDDDNRVISRPALATPAIANSDSRMVYGCFSLYQIVFFGKIKIVKDEVSLAKNHMTRFIFHLGCDAFALQSEAFARSTDAANQ